MYCLQKKPPEVSHFNDYILKYKTSKDEQFLQYYLHCYESDLNKRTMLYCNTYDVRNHFADIKQTIITTLISLINKYDPVYGITLMTFAYRYIRAAVRKYVRENCGTVNVSEHHYKNLRNVMVAYNGDMEATETERLANAVDDTGLSIDTVREHLMFGEYFLYSESLNDDEWNDGDESYIRLIERVSNGLKSPEQIVLKKMLYEAIAISVDKLQFKEKRLILDYIGLERYLNWFIEVEPLSKEIIAANLHLGKAQSVDYNFRKAIKVLQSELKDAGWL
jgi:DNA-directed RNA polymerase specialized sigma subunit